MDWCPSVAHSLVVPAVAHSDGASLRHVPMHLGSPFEARHHGDCGDVALGAAVGAVDLPVRLWPVAVAPLGHCGDAQGAHHLGAARCFLGIACASARCDARSGARTNDAHFGTLFRLVYGECGGSGGALRESCSESLARVARHTACGALGDGCCRGCMGGQGQT